MYQEFLKFLLQFCCMNLIAATRAEGGLVFKQTTQFSFQMPWNGPLNTPRVVAHFDFEFTHLP